MMTTSFPFVYRPKRLRGLCGLKALVITLHRLILLILHNKILFFSTGYSPD